MAHTKADFRRLLLTIAVPLVVAMCASGQATPSPAKLTNQEVVRMIRSGETPESVIAKIKASTPAFDLSASGMDLLAEADLPERVAFAVIDRGFSAARDTVKNLPQASQEELAADKQQLHSRCNGCKIVFFASVDPSTAEITGNVLLPEQLKALVREKQKNVIFGKDWMLFVVTSHPENADYYILTSEAFAYRAYIRTSPAATTGGAAERVLSLQDLHVTLRTEHNEVAASQVSEDLAIVDAHTGNIIFQTHHSGRFAWSKPEKDCLNEAFRFMRRAERSLQQAAPRS